MLFNAGPEVAERIRNFRLDRIAKIAAGQAPVQLMDRGSVVLHIVPLSAFDVNSTSLPLHQIERDYHTFIPFGSQSASGARITFEGVLKTSNADQQAGQHRAYLQLYRNGIVETVDSTVTARNSGTPIIWGLDDKLVYETLRNLEDLARFGVEPPYAILISLLEVMGARIHLVRNPNDPAWYDNLSRALDREQYHFDDVIFETVPASQAECAIVIRPALDQIANAGGSATSPIFRVGTFRFSDPPDWDHLELTTYVTGLPRRDRLGLIASLGRRSASSGLPQSTDKFRILSVSPRSQSGGR